MSAIKIIQALGRKIAAKKSKTPEGITQIQPTIYSESEASNIAQRLVNAGLPMEKFDEFIFSEADLVRLLNQIEAMEKRNLAESIRSGIRDTKTAKVFDLEGKEIDPKKGIMGGKQIQDVEDAGEGFIEFVRRTDPEGAAKLQKEEDRIKAMIEAANKRAAKNLKDKKKKLDDPDKKADGGRIGYKIGSIDKARRAFLKTAATIGGGIAALKTGMLGLTKGATPAVEKAVETVTEAPSYFFDLVAKIKLFGKPGISVGPRQNTMNYKNYELMEDISTGDIRITKQKGDPEFAYEEEVMEFRKGKRTEDGIIPDEYEEATIRPDGDGKMKDVDIGIEPEGIKEIMDEVKEAPSIKKASGGIARMLGE